MAALTSADWTISVIDRRITNNQRVNRCSMTLATVGTYPTGGVPIPTAASSWGFVQQFKYLNLYDHGQDLLRVVKYSATGNVIRFYQSGITSGGAQADLLELATTATAGTGGLVILYAQAFGW